MREIKFIPRPEVMEPCSDCGRVGEVCASCKSDIAEAVWAEEWESIHSNDMFMQQMLEDAERAESGKNWIGDDGVYL